MDFFQAPITGKLDFFQAAHLVQIESTKGDALEMIAILADRGQITVEIEEKLQDMVSKTWG